LRFTFYVLLFPVPELPEVEVLVRHLAPLLQGKTIRQVCVRRKRVLAATPSRLLERTLTGARFTGLSRRGKYLLFELCPPGQLEPLVLLGHLGMTGRMDVAAARAPLPKHAAVVLDLGQENFIFEDTRYFGRLTLAIEALAKLGPEPLGDEFTAAEFGRALRRSRQAIKVKLLDQSLVAGVGNIYASEALFQAGISPRRSANKLKAEQVAELWRCVRLVLSQAIENGSTVPLNYSGAGKRDGLFYFGRAPEAEESYSERFWVYDREGQPCRRCQAPIKRLVQAGRSTFYCPRCQRG
jgi:formamidopyrimidine-DNA glycosylase